jgi:hypothetical protein
MGRWERRHKYLERLRGIERYWAFVSVLKGKEDSRVMEGGGCSVGGGDGKGERLRHSWEGSCGNRIFEKRARSYRQNAKTNLVDRRNQQKSQ